MIRNSPNGGRTIIYTNRFAPRGKDVDNIFPANFGACLPPNGFLEFSIALKDGLSYTYWYSFTNVITDPNYTTLNAQLNRVPLDPNDPNQQPWGGELFNASVRATLIGKELSGSGGCNL